MGQVLHAAWAQVIVILTAGGFEGAGIPWPGAVVVAGAGAAAGGNWQAIAAVSLSFSLAYCLGALTQYGIGRLFGPAILGWLPDTQRSKLDALMARYGALAVLWGRIFAIGNYVSIPAGMARMPLPRFLLFTFVGILPWAVGMALIGRFVGNLGPVEEIARQWLLPALLVCVGLSLAPAAWNLIRSRQAAA